MSGAAAIKLPPFSGSPSHHSPLRVKLPVLTNPTGADTSHCNSNSPMLFTESNASVTVPPGATIGKSNSSVGVPFENEAEFRFVDMNQFALSVFSSEYPQPTIDPGAPRTLPSDGIRLKITSAEAEPNKNKNNPTTRIGCKNSLFLISISPISWNDRLSDRIAVTLGRAVHQIAILGQGESRDRGGNVESQGHRC